MALSITGINSFTQKYFVARQTNVWSKYSPLLYLSRTKRKFKFYGGTSINEPITFRPLNAYAIGRGQSVDISWINVETNFTVIPKIYAAIVVLYAYDGLLNMGPEAVLSQVETRIKNASEALGQVMASEVHFSGLSNAQVGTELSGTDTGALSFDGLAQWINDGSSGGPATVGGVTRTDIAPGGNAYVANIGGIIQTTNLNTAMGKTWFGPDRRVDWLLMNQDTFQYVINKLQPQQMFDKSDDIAASFNTIRYQGIADLIVDNYCPPGVIWGISTPTYKFWVGQNPLYQFGFTGFKEDQATVGDVAGQYVYGGNITYPEPRAGALLYGITG